MFKYGTTSENRIQGLDPGLVSVLRLVIQRSKVDVMVAEGLRSKKRQANLLAQGKTWTLNSRHLTGHAVDIAPLINGKVPWNDPKPWVELSKVVFECADELGVILQWGGDWDLDGEWRDESKFDGPHYQIPWPYNIEKAKAAQKKRTMLGRELSPDITPGITPDEMDDSKFASPDVEGVVKPPKKKKARKKKATKE